MKKKKATALSGSQLLVEPLLNKGTAFTEKEREAFKLHGLLPFHVSTIEEQVKRRYENFLQQKDPIAKYTFLNALQTRNEVLFYRFVLEHVSEMLPLIYTPTIGNISTNYSSLYRGEQRGLYISYPLKDKMKTLIDNFPLSQVDVIVVTDGERILGLGDLGVGGIAIPIGKLALYTLFGGIHPARTLPIVLDVGTNNKEMLEDPLYLGWRHKRIPENQYTPFVDQFVKAIKKRFPHVLLQWEDFAKPHALPLLNHYRNKICSFNDDIQGTACVTLAAVLAAAKRSKTLLKDQRFAVLGGGSAGLGICNQIVRAIIDESGLSEEEARSLFYVVDIKGLLYEGQAGLDPAQKPFAQKKETIRKWKIKNKENISLLEVVENAHPTMLFGVSAQGGVFTQEIVKAMAKHVKRPIIFPLSNPTSRSEAEPKDLINWTSGEAIIATGSPFAPISYKNRLYHIGQCNNVYIFPGVGLGLIAAKATYVSDEVFLVAAKILSKHSPMLTDPYGPIFPPLDKLRDIGREIGIAVAKTVIKEGHSSLKKVGSVEKLVDATMWYPKYPSYA